VRSDFPLQAWYRVQQQTNKRPRNGLKQPLRPAQPVSELPRKLGAPHDVAEMTAALQRETRTIPIVFLGVADPVGDGFVADLPRPGGNITGFINLTGRQLTAIKVACERTTTDAAAHYAGVAVKNVPTPSARMLRHSTPKCRCPSTPLSWSGRGSLIKRRLWPVVPSGRL
jgi:hypothetical protein